MKMIIGMSHVIQQTLIAQSCQICSLLLAQSCKQLKISQSQKYNFKSI
jgi:hypothetical protein